MKQKLPQKIFVTGIGTGVGKTVAAAVLTQALQANYWKPVQCGGLEHTDSQEVKGLLSNTTATIFPEQYRFKTPSSPHYAAQFEGVKLQVDGFNCPDSLSRLVIEGAGGLMVPLNSEELIIDLIAHFNLPVILVAQHYLGGINHALLSLDALNHRNINTLGVIFNGRAFLDNEEIITLFAKTRVLGHIDQAMNVDKAFVNEQAQKLNQSLNRYFEI